MKNNSYNTILSQEKIDTLSKNISLAKSNVEINTLIEEFVSTLLDAEFSSLWFYDKQELRLIRERKDDERRILSLDVNSGIMHKCFMTKQGGIYNYLASDRDYVASIDNPDNIKIKSKIILPLVNNDQLIGIITSYTSIKKIKKFTTDDMEILEVISPFLINILNKMHIDSQATLRDEAVIEEGLFKDKVQKKTSNETLHLMANFVHDIRTPANTLYGFLELLEDQINDKRLKEYLQNAKESASFINELTSSMLNIVKLQKEAQESTLVEIDSVNLFANITDMFSSNMYAKHISFNVYIDPLLPKKIIVDELKLKRTIMNLLSNAYKFTPYGKNIEFSLKYNNSEKKIAISVVDKGIGIPKEKQEEIFEAFKQVDDSISQTYGGTGLGLFICAEYIRDLGGKLQLESELEKGTKFYFDIPIDVKEDKECYTPIDNGNFKVTILMDTKNTFTFMNIARHMIIMGVKKENIFAVTSFSKIPSETTNLMVFQNKIDEKSTAVMDKMLKVMIVEEELFSIEKDELSNNWDVITQYGYFASTLYKFINTKTIPKVLIVDDDKTSIMLIEKILESEFCEIDTALNGKLALEMLLDSHKKQYPYNVVYIDNKMPIMNGKEVIRNLREFEQDNNLDAILAVSTTGDAINLKTDGKDFNYYIGKPFKANEIREVLNY